MTDQEMIEKTKIINEVIQKEFPEYDFVLHLAPEAGGKCETITDMDRENSLRLMSHCMNSIYNGRIKVFDAS